MFTAFWNSQGCMQFMSSGFQQLQKMSFNNSITVGLATPVMACLNVYYMEYSETVLLLHHMMIFPS